MPVPLQFPDPMELARERAEAFQRLSADERWREISALAAFGLEMARNSFDPQAVEKRMQELESQWQKIQQELFARHAG